MAPSLVDTELPDEISKLLEDHEHGPEAVTSSSKLDELARIGLAIGKKKNEAMNFRASSGIESTWLQCEEAYNGIDDANRGEYRGSRWVKPTTMNAPLTSEGQGQGTKAPSNRSNVFVRITTRYVDAASAKIGEIVLPIDDKAFSFTATPIPDLIGALKDTTQAMTPEGHPATRPANPGEVPQGTMSGPMSGTMPVAPDQGPPPAPRVPLTNKDLAEEKMEQANESAKKAEMRIYDWQVECGHAREMRKVFFDAARIGVGILKGPFPIKKRRMALTGEGQEKKLTIKEEIKPADKWVDPWNVFPDPACGENIADGDYIFERDYFSEKQLRDLKGLPGYHNDQIDLAVLSGARHSTSPSKNPNEPENKEPFEIWFFTGSLKRDDFSVLNPKASETIPKDQGLVHAVVTMVNDIVIKGVVNPLDTGRLNYHSMPWTRRPGYWAGVGVSEQIHVPQRIVNGATRALLNNGGLSAGPQVVVNREGIRPADGEWELTPNKVWYSSKETNTDDIRKTFLTFDVGNVGDRIMKIVEYGLRLAEESTNIPLITQGMSGKTTPDTLGAATLQDNNANQLLRSVGYAVDDSITVPLTDGYYEYLLLDPNVPDDEKGDWNINAHGSVAMVERSIADQTVAQMTPLAQDPQFGVDPKKWFAVLAKSKHLNPKDFQYSKEEQEKLDSAPKPEAPSIEVAKIKVQATQMQIQAGAQRAQAEDALAMQIAQLEAETAKEIENIRNTTDQLKVKMDTDRDLTYVQAETEKARSTYTHNMQLLALKKSIAELEYASRHQISLESVKAKLASDAMKINAQRELSLAQMQVEVHKHHVPSGDALLPPVQTPGKAGNGNAFTQNP